MSRSKLQIISRIWSLLGQRRRYEVALLAAATVVGTFLETLSLGAVVPFIGILVDPAVVVQHPLLGPIVARFDFASPDDLVIPITVGFIAMALVVGVARLALTWATHYVSFTIGSELSLNLFRRTLYQPFSVHVTRNSSLLITGITRRITQTTNVLQGLLLGFTSAVVSLGIIVTLLLIDPIVATLTAFAFGGSYLVVARASRRRLTRNSERIKRLSTRLVQALQESLGGIREVLLDGAQDTHALAYQRLDRPMRRSMASNRFLAAGPRMVIDALGITGIAILACVLTQRPGGVGAFLPVLGALAMGAQRLLPAFQRIYAGYASYMGHYASLNELVGLLEQPLPQHAFEPPSDALSFRKDIRFENVSFRYDEATPWVLEDVNLVIQKGWRVGFVGKTGEGKSTALDLLMGLLEPTKGRVLVDSNPIVGSHGRAWQRAVAHVPQSIFLADTTIGENIAFGVEPSKVDAERVRQAAQLARIAEHIEAQPDAYDATVGERGVRLSGGQRQRLGIARALYKSANVLILDEATSALDAATERELMDAIGELSRELTVLMIAHRLSTIERCDRIVLIDKGKVAAVDTYDNLLKTSELFRSLTAQHKP